MRTRAHDLDGRSNDVLSILLITAGYMRRAGLQVSVASALHRYRVVLAKHEDAAEHNPGKQERDAAGRHAHEGSWIR